MRISDWSSDVCSSDLFESAAIENLVPRDERRLCPPEAPVPAARLRAIFIDYAKRNLADLHQHRLWIASGALVEAFACRRSEEHTSELQSLMRISYDVFCLKKKKPNTGKLYKQYTY